MRFTRIKTGLLDSNMNGLTWQTLLTSPDGDEYKKSDLLNQHQLSICKVWTNVYPFQVLGWMGIIYWFLIWSIEAENQALRKIRDISATRICQEWFKHSSLYHVHQDKSNKSRLTN